MEVRQQIETQLPSHVSYYRQNQINSAKQQIVSSFNIYDSKKLQQEQQLRNEINILNTTLTQLKQQNQIEIQKLQNIIQQQKNEIEQLQKQTQQQKDKNYILNKELQQLQQQYKDLNQNRIKEQGNYQRQMAHEVDINQRSKNDNFDQYDIEIILRSISDFGDKVQFIRNPNVSNEIHDNFQKKEIILTGFSGSHNAGKSFVVSKLLDKTFQQGLLQRTFGFNLIYPKDNQKMCFIDTRGTGEALCLFESLINVQDSDQYNQMLQAIQQEKEEKYKNLKATEKFSSGFITDSCSILIHVIGQLNGESLAQINKISQQTINNQQQLYVIHNLQNLTTNESIEKHIETIRQNFNFGQDYQQFDEQTGCVFYKEKPKDINSGCKSIFHIILGCEGRESGNTYNQKSINFLKSQLNGTSIPEQKYQRFELLFRDYVNSYLHKFIEPKNEDLLENNKHLEDQNQKFQNFVIKQEGENTYIQNDDIQNQQFRIKDIHFDLYGDILTPFNYNQIYYKIFENENTVMIWVAQLFCEYTVMEDQQPVELIFDENTKTQKLKIKYEYDSDAIKEDIEQLGYKYDNLQKCANYQNQVKIPLFVEGLIDLGSIQDRKLNSNVEVKNYDSYMQITLEKENKTKLKIERKLKRNNLKKEMKSDEYQQQQLQQDRKNK